MTSRAPGTRRVLLAIAALILALFVAVASMHAYRRANPELAYQQITGRKLPSGVHASAYNFQFDDSLLHIAHYWVLTGSEAELRRFAASASLGESTEDARWMLPDLSNLFGDRRTRDDVAVGFEGDQAKNDWLWVFKGGSDALYEYN